MRGRRLRHGVLGKGGTGGGAARSRPARFVARHHAHLAMAHAQRRPLPLDHRPQATRIGRRQLVAGSPAPGAATAPPPTSSSCSVHRHVNCGNIAHDGRGRTLPVIHETSPLWIANAGSVPAPAVARLMASTRTSASSRGIPVVLRAGPGRSTTSPKARPAAAAARRRLLRAGPLSRASASNEPISRGRRSNPATSGTILTWPLGSTAANTLAGSARSADRRRRAESRTADRRQPRRGSPCRR